MKVARPRETRTLDAAARADLGGSYQALTDGVTHFQLRGPEQGRVVVMLHGGTVPLWTWELQVPALVEAGFRVLSYDMFGRGYSDRPAVVYDRALYRRQLGQLLDTLGVAQPVDLVGTSFGGAVAVDFAMHRPDRLRRIALIAPVVRSVANPLLAPLRLPVVGELLMRTIVARKITARAAEFFAHTSSPETYLARYIEPTAFCYPAGMPRLMTRYGALMILQYPTAIFIMSRLNNEYRVIFMDGRNREPENIRDKNWSGESLGHWEGDTLVIETEGFTDDNHLIQQGIFAGDQLKVTERFTMLNNGNTIKMDFIMTDPEHWVGEWRHTKFRDRLLKSDVREANCLFEDNEALPGMRPGA